MELFLPSLFVLALTFFIVVFFLPRFSPFLIFIMCSVFLVIASYVHFKMYSNEYRNLIFFDPAKTGPVIILAVIIIGVILALSNLTKGFQFKMPRITLGERNMKQISNVKDLTNIPFNKIKELESQV